MVQSSSDVLLHKLQSNLHVVKEHTQDKYPSLARKIESRFYKISLPDGWQLMEDGSYAFTGIAYRQIGYFAVAFDHGNNPLNAAISDFITPEPMT